MVFVPNLRSRRAVDGLLLWIVMGKGDRLRQAGLLKTDGCRAAEESRLNQGAAV